MGDYSSESAKIKMINFLELVSISYGLVAGFISLWLFFLGINKIPFIVPIILLPVLTICLTATLILYKKRKTIKLPETTNFLKNKNTLFIIFVTVIGGIFLWSLMQTIIWPPSEWDALALYDYRAVRFFETKSLAQSVLTNYLPLVTYNYSYPFFTSLLHAFIYLLGGNNPQFLYSLVYVAFIVCFYYCLRRRTTKLISMLITLAFATTPSFVYQSTVSYTNLFYSFYLGMGTIYFWEWVADRKNRYFAISALFLGLSTFIRSQEPFWMANLLIVFIYCLKKRQIKKIIVYFAAFFLLRQPWIIYRDSVYASVPNLVQDPYRFSIQIGKIYEVIPYVVSNLASDWKVIFLLLIFMLVLARKKIIKYWYIIGLIMFDFLIVFLGTYYLSINFDWWNRIGGSAVRMSMFFIPLILYAVAILFYAKIFKDVK